MDQRFCHLHLHTEYSPQDAPVGLKEMVEYAKEIGYKSIAVTDHGTIAAWVKFQDLCKKSGMKPIFGVEAYFTPDRNAREDRKDNYHQILLAKTNEGIRNIYRLIELSYSEGFYYNPRVDWELLEKYKEGIICTSACVSGIVPETYAKLGKEPAKEIAKRFRSIYGDDYYLEVQFHGMEIEDAYIGVAEIAAELGIKIVGTNDVHYLKRKDHFVQEDLMALNMGRCVKDPTRLQHSMHQFYLKSPEEMLEIFGGKDAIAVLSTLEIAEKCNAEIEMGKTQLPSVDVPKGMTDFKLLEQKCWKGLAARSLDEKPEYVERLKNELALVKKLREEKGLMFDRYFLVVADYVCWAWDNGIRVGVGRGSGAGSLILYCLRITGIDPIKYDLLFERFLAEDRIQMPDIDIDFDAERGEEPIEYCKRRFGADRCARIGTIQKFHVASAIKAAYRVYDPGNTWESKQQDKKDGKRKEQSTRDETARMSDEATKMLPRAHERDKNPDPRCTLRKDVKVADDKRIYVYDHVPEFMDLKRLHPEMFRFAEHIEGLVKDRSVHAAGVLITESPTIGFAPQQFAGRQKNMATAYDMEDIERIGGIKFDFLRTKVLSVITRAIRSIKVRYNIDIPIDDLEPNDKDVFELFSRGDTDAVFQFESDGMKHLLRDMKPDCFDDIVAANALFRPGPMQYIPAYINRKHGRESVSYVVPILEPILKPTYGIIVYQEQVMKTVRVLAGFSAAEADTVRKAMGKKKKDILDKMKEKFIEGCARLKTCQTSVASQLWSEMEKFAEYAFNKSHAAGYGYTAYQCAYLKHYYPAEFMAAQLTVEGWDAKYETIIKYERHAKAMGLTILPLDLNLSSDDYTVVETKSGKSIRRGFKGIKGIGSDACRDIVSQKRPYTDLFDYCSRSGAGTKSDVVKVLIDEGAFDWMLKRLSERKLEGKASRPDIEKEYEDMVKRVRSERNEKGARREEKEGIAEIFADQPGCQGNISLDIGDF